MPTGASADPGSTAQARLASLTRRLAAAEKRQSLLDDRAAKLDRAVAKQERELAAVRKRFGVRAKAIYEGGYGGDPLVVMMTAKDPGEVVTRLELFDAATRADGDLVRRGSGLARRLRDERRELDGLRHDAAATAAALRRDYGDLRTLLARLEAAGRRTTRASRSRAILHGRYACLVGPNHAYTDTWGDPRPGGRRHKGTDVFAPWGSPAYAVTDGVVRRISTSYYGGLQLYLRGNDGNEYFYAHLSSYTSHAGQRVAAGEQVARVGNTGDARYTSPHVHFEVHPGGGTPVNPYPYVRRFCP